MNKETKEWHEYFIKTKFTDSKEEAKRTGKKFVESREQRAYCPDPMAKTMIQEQGDLTGW